MCSAIYGCPCLIGQLSKGRISQVVPLVSLDLFLVKVEAYILHAEPREAGFT